MLWLNRTKINGLLQSSVAPLHHSLVTSERMVYGVISCITYSVLLSLGSFWLLFPSYNICASMHVCVCPDGRSLEVALTLHPWLAFRSTEKPGQFGDGRAESTWTAAVSGLDIQLRRYVR